MDLESVVRTPVLQVPQTPDDIRTGSSDTSRTVLLVDDEREVIGPLEQALALLGYLVTTAVNGADAAEKALALRPRAVVTDLLMPVLDGIGLAKALRANPATADAKIVLCSGVAEGSVRRLFSDYDAFLPKPFELEDLCAMLSALLPVPALPVDPNAAAGST